jgi:diacylglycerol kinase family enzyme
MTCVSWPRMRVSRGADLLGMAGGDGSLALVTSIASHHGIPFVVIPAGTRNHFALDLGLDAPMSPAH